MAAAFKFEIVTPERVLMSADVEQVLVPGADGDMTVLGGHSPVISTLRPGLIEAKGTDGKTTRIYVRGGFVEIAPESLTVLAENAANADTMSADAVAADIKAAEARLAAATDDETRWLANTAIDSLKRMGKVA